MNLFSLGKSGLGRFRKVIRSSFFPLFFTAFDLVPSRYIYVRWHGSQRKGIFYFKFPDELSRIEKINPPEDEIDFVIYILLPLFRKNIETSPLPRVDDQRLLFWIPARPDIGNYQKFSYYFLNKKEYKNDIESTLRRLYTQGLIVNSCGSYFNFCGKNIREEIENIIRIQLDRVYYKFPPLSDLNPLNIEQICNYYSQYKVTDFIEQTISDGKIYSIFNDLYPVVRCKPYGLCSLSFKYLILYLYMKDKYKFFASRDQPLFFSINEIENFDKIFHQIKYIRKRKVLDNETWQQCIKISNILGNIDLSLSPDLDQQDKFWESIICTARHYRDKIPNAIKKLWKMCYTINQEEQIEEIVNSLQSVYHLFDREFYLPGGDSRTGIIKFLHIIKNCFSNLSDFCLKINSVQSFFTSIDRNDVEYILNCSKYLEDCTLPENEYSSLRTKKKVLLGYLENIKLLVLANIRFNSFENIFEEFKIKYITIYCQEHEKYREKVRRFNNKMYSLPEYKLYSLLLELSGLKSEVDDVFSSFFQEECSCNNLRLLLDKKPVCDCGFRPGNRYNNPDINKVKPLLMKKTGLLLEKLIENKQWKSIGNKIASLEANIDGFKNNPDRKREDKSIIFLLDSYI